MIKFYLLELWPAPIGSANKVLAEIERPSRKDAILSFKQTHPALLLDEDGYAKNGIKTYCIAESNIKQN